MSKVYIESAQYANAHLYETVMVTDEFTGMCLYKTMNEINHHYSQENIELMFNGMSNNGLRLTMTYPMTTNERCYQELIDTYSVSPEEARTYAFIDTNKSDLEVEIDNDVFERMYCDYQRDDTNDEIPF